MAGSNLWIIIMGVSLVTLLPRILPVAWFSRYDFPDWLKDWLSYVAPAVLGALTALSVLAPEGKLDFALSNNYLWAFIPSFLTAVKTRNLFYTLVAGIFTMAILYNF